MHKEIPPEEFYRLINHGPCVIISSGDALKTNIAPAAWIMPVNDDPPLAAVALAENNYTAELIDAAGTFVINIPDEQLLRRLLGAGKISGRETDKIKKFGVVLEKGGKINTPHLAEAVGWIECEVRDGKVYDGVILFVGKVLYASVREDVYDGCLDPAKCPAVHHLGGGWFEVGRERVKL